MPPASPRSFWPGALLRAARFLYLLWGGLLMTILAVQDRLRFPDWLWHWPEAVRFLGRPLGRGLLLGLGLSLGIAALLEIWELVDDLLVRWMNEHERDR